MPMCHVCFMHTMTGKSLIPHNYTQKLSSAYVPIRQNLTIITVILFKLKKIKITNNIRTTLGTNSSC